MSNDVAQPPVLPGALTLFVRELVASPRRWKATLRLSAAATLATAGILAFHVPHGEYLVVILFLVGANDAWGSLRRAWWRLGGLVVGSILCVAALASLSDKPWILFPLQCLLLGAVIFASRTTTVPYAPLLVAVCFLLTVPEYIASPAATMDKAVWSLGMIGLGVVGGTVLQLVLWREKPQDLLLENFAERFRVVQEVLSNALESSPSGPRRPVHGLVAATSIARQLQLLEDAEDESPFLRQRHTEQLKLITDMQLLVRGALEVERTLQETTPTQLLTPYLQARMRQVLVSAGSLQRALEQRQLAEMTVAPLAQGTLPAPGASSGAVSDLQQAVAQMERALEAMPDKLGFLAGLRGRAEEVPAQHPSVAARPVLTAAFRLDNVEELRVAVKAALAIALCGLTYETLAWPGISACVFAILLLAQGSVGASLERAVVQICGVLVGATWAFLVVVVAMPNMTSLASLLVLLFPLYFAVSWFAFGGGVTTAAALQMAMAAVLVLLPDFGPTTDLIPARDRVVGILLGNVIFAAINLSLWPVYAGTPGRLAHILRELGILEQRIAQGDHEGARAQAFGIHRSLAEALALQDQARFEPHPPLVRGTLLRLTASMQEVFQEALDAGRLQWAPSVQAMPASLRAPLGELALGVSRRLDTLADCLQKGVLEPEPAAPLEGLLDRVREAGADMARSADFEAYLILSRRLLLAVSRLDAVLRSYTGLLANTAASVARPHPQAS